MKQFGECIGLLDALAKYSVIFSHIGHVTMATEAPNPPMGGLGRVEGAKNGLTGVNTTGARDRESLKEINCMAKIFCDRGKCLLHFHSNSCCS